MAGFPEISERFGFAYTLKQLVGENYNPKRESEILKTDVYSVYFRLIMDSHEAQTRKQYSELLKQQR